MTQPLHTDLAGYPPHTTRASETPRRVLFVDDEQSILHGLARTLRPLRFEMVYEFAQGGREALERLAREPFDVVVADMRMPGMDGMTLLAEVQKRHPHVIRIIFSGNPEVDSAVKALTVAHQYISKPCEADRLRSVILRAIHLRDLLADRELRTLVAGVKDLPARPEIYLRLTKLLADGSAGAAEIAKLLEGDAALCAKLLKIVNSGFFGPSRRVSSIEAAVMFLGTSLLRSLTLATSTTAALAPRARQLGYDMDAAQSRAMLAAHLAKQFFTDKAASEDAFAAALLQDIGEILLMAEGSEDLACVLAHAQESGIPPHAAERELGVVSHAHVGAFLLGAWGLPYNIVEAVAHHHDPQALEHSQLDLVDAVHAATLIARGYLEPSEDALQQGQRYLERFGNPSRVAKICDIAEQCARDGVRQLG